MCRDGARRIVAQPFAGAQSENMPWAWLRTLPLCGWCRGTREWGLSRGVIFVKIPGGSIYASSGFLSGKCGRFGADYRSGLEQSQPNDIDNPLSMPARSAAIGEIAGDKMNLTNRQMCI